MKNGIISVRLDSVYETMVERLRLPGERDSDLLKRAIDALALTDENLAVILGPEDEAPLSESDKEFLKQYEQNGHTRVSTLIFESPKTEE